MYRKKTKGWLGQIDFFLIDGICLEFALISAFIINRDLRGAVLYVPVYQAMAVILLMVQYLVVMFANCYDSILKRRARGEFLSVLREAVLIILGFAVFCFFSKKSEYFSRGVLGLTAIFYTMSAWVLRTFWKRYLNSKKSDPKNRTAMMIVGEKDTIETTIRRILDQNYERVNICGCAVLDEDLTGQEIAGIPVICNTGNIVSYVAENWVDEVFVDLIHLQNNAEYERLIREMFISGVTIHQNLEPFDVLQGRQQSLERIASYNVLTTSIKILTNGQAFQKRMLDIIGGIVGCILTVILFFFVAPLIYIKSPGPIFFSQIRIGKNGKPFRIYKFRSMYLDAEERKQQVKEELGDPDLIMFKLENDPRIIGSDPEHPGKGIGNFIRSYSIDEFPQFWNVLKGDMSLVGSRPPAVDEWQQYELHHHARMANKPGLTGMWQISGRSNLKDFEQVVAMDTKYMEDWSFWKDIRIILKTVVVVLSKQGAM